MTKTYRCEFQVRGYELDSFGHVNHAVYLNYLEYARWSMLREEGITVETFTSWKRWPVIAQVEIKYLKPCRMHDRLVVETRVVEPKRSSVHFEQRVLRLADGREPELVAEARIRSVTVDETGRPAESPAELKALAE
jgi:thioesterase-3